MTLETKFNLHQEIYIKDLKVKGLVIDIFYNGVIQYNVRYFSEGAKSVYFYEWELQSYNNQDFKDTARFKT